MSKIIGVTVGTPVPQSDWNQNNPNRADYIKNKPDLESMFGHTSSQINKLDKRITNLEQGILPSPFETDSTVAYQKSVPTNALPYAEVEKVGGMTRKCANLLDTNGVSASANGLTMESITDGGVKINGTKFGETMTKWKTFSNFVLPIGKYVLSANLTKGGISADVWVYIGDGSYLCKVGSTLTIEITEPQTINSVGLYSGDYVVFENAVVELMLNEGSTALPYEPYFSGLRSAPVEEVESVGANIWDEQWFNGYLNEKTGEYIEDAARGVCSKNFIPVIPNETYSLDMWCWLSFYDKNYNFVSAFEHCKNYIGASFTVPSNACFMKFQGINEIYGTVYNNDLIINKGSTALPYSPYVRNTLPIPSAVQALEGYGWGINESVYNYIDWEKKQFVQMVGKVDIGTLAWVWYEPGFFSVSMDSYKNLNKAVGGDFISDTYRKIANRTDKEMADAPDLTICHHPDGVWLDIKDTKYGNDANAFKAGVSGSMLYYELAEPIITDISDILSEDNFIGVAGGGTVTFKNQYEYAVPSEITYQIKGANV